MRWIWLGLTVLGLLSGLCTIFAAVVTAAQAWQEHGEASWPELTARVEQCGLKQTSTGRRNGYYIRCRLSYSVGDDRTVATIYSRNVPSRDVWQYPPNQIEPFEKWVAEHPPGTPMEMRYDPAKHTKIVLMADYMPGGGPRTSSNIRLLGVCAGSFLVLLTISRVTRRARLA